MLAPRRTATMRAGRGLVLPSRPSRRRYYLFAQPFSRRIARGSCGARPRSATPGRLAERNHGGARRGCGARARGGRAARRGCCWGAPDCRAAAANARASLAMTRDTAARRQPATPVLPDLGRGCRPSARPLRGGVSLRERASPIPREGCRKARAAARVPGLAPLGIACCCCAAAPSSAPASAPRAGLARRRHDRAGIRACSSGSAIAAEDPSLRPRGAVWPEPRGDCEAVLAPRVGARKERDGAGSWVFGSQTDRRRSRRSPVREPGTPAAHLLGTFFRDPAKRRGLGRAGASSARSTTRTHASASLDARDRDHAPPPPPRPPSRVLVGSSPGARDDGAASRRPLGVVLSGARRAGAGARDAVLAAPTPPRGAVAPIAPDRSEVERSPSSRASRTVEIVHAASTCARRTSSAAPRRRAPPSSRAASPERHARSTPLGPARRALHSRLRQRHADGGARSPRRGRGPVTSRARRRDGRRRGLASGRAARGECAPTARDFTARGEGVGSPSGLPGRQPRRTRSTARARFAPWDALRESSTGPLRRHGRARTAAADARRLPPRRPRTNRAAPWSR